MFWLLPPFGTGEGPSQRKFSVDHKADPFDNLLLDHEQDGRRQNALHDLGAHALVESRETLVANHLGDGVSSSWGEVQEQSQPQIFFFQKAIACNNTSVMMIFVTAGQLLRLKSRLKILEEIKISKSQQFNKVKIRQ